MQKENGERMLSFLTFIFNISNIHIFKMLHTHHLASITNILPIFFQLHPFYFKYFKNKSQTHITTPVHTLMCIFDRTKNIYTPCHHCI